MKAFVYLLNKNTYTCMQPFLKAAKIEYCYWEDRRMVRDWRWL